MPTLSKTKRKTRITSLMICFLFTWILFGETKNVQSHHFLQLGSITNGYALNFILQIKETIPQKPNNYSLDLVNRLSDRYSEKNESDLSCPTIIVIMNESLADYETIGKMKTNRAVMPFLTSLRNEKNVVSGFALSSVFGGGTANSEFEFLTGNSMAFLPSGSIAYQQFVNEDTYSLISPLSNRGYECIAMHPYLSNGWERDRVYSDFGFDKFYTINDFDEENVMREYITDEELYRKIIETYENRKSDKQFIFGVSMQNHGSYDYIGDDFVEKITVEGYKQKYSDVNQYLTLVNESDRAFKDLIEYFSVENEDVIVLMFGDHQPNLDPGFYEELYGNKNTLECQQLRYYVPFWIWANYDIEEQDNVLTSINYLSNYLLDKANINLPMYNQFLFEIQNTVPAINSNGYYSKNQSSMNSIDNAAGQDSEMIKEYQVMQYNNLFENVENRIDWFQVSGKE